MLRWMTIRPFATFFTKSLKSDEVIPSTAKSPNVREIVDSDGMPDCDSHPQSLRIDVFKQRGLVREWCGRGVLQLPLVPFSFLKRV
jgi:hypothetical protein